MTKGERTLIRQVETMHQALKDLRGELSQQYLSTASLALYEQVKGERDAYAAQIRAMLNAMNSAECAASDEFLPYLQSQFDKIRRAGETPAVPKEASNDVITTT